MAGGTNLEEEDDDIAAARWVMAIEDGLDPRREAEFHAWLAADADRAELVARQAALPAMARQAQLQAQLESAAKRVAQQEQARRLANEQALASRRRFMLGGAIAAGVAAAGVTALIAPWKTNETLEDVYETAIGEVRTIELADASKLWLDTRTRASTRLTRERRDVHLGSGRMFVEVAHDAQRPFFVRGAGFEARALGTAFEATVFADRAGVAVTEGVVRLTVGKKSVDLAKGQCAWISPSGELTAYAAPAIAAWRQHRMVLSNQRLDAALAELSRYFEQTLSVADAQLAARRVTLSFSIADITEEDAARIIASAVEADVVADMKGGILLRPVPRETGPVNPR